MSPSTSKLLTMRIPSPPPRKKTLHDGPSKATAKAPGAPKKPTKQKGLKKPSKPSISEVLSSLDMARVNEFDNVLKKLEADINKQNLTIRQMWKIMGEIKDMNSNSNSNGISNDGLPVKDQPQHPYQPYPNEDACDVVEYEMDPRHNYLEFGDSVLRHLPLASIPFPDLSISTPGDFQAPPPIHTCPNGTACQVCYIDVLNSILDGDGGDESGGGAEDDDDKENFIV